MRPSHCFPSEAEDLKRGIIRKLNREEFESGARKFTFVDPEGHRKRVTTGIFEKEPALDDLYMRRHARTDKKISLNDSGSNKPESKSVSHIREVEGNIRGASLQLEKILHRMQGNVSDAVPQFKNAESQFSDSLLDLRDSNLKVNEEATHHLTACLYQSIKWKADLIEDLRRIKEGAREDPLNAVNSKVRRNLTFE